MMYVNKALSKKYGKPLSYTDGEHTKSKTTGHTKNASIMSNPNTKSDRLGYGVNGVHGKMSGSSKMSYGSSSY